MIKKILFTIFLVATTLGFSQEKTIENISTAPNPFSVSTKISYQATTASKITLDAAL